MREIQNQGGSRARQRRKRRKRGCLGRVLLWLILMIAAVVFGGRALRSMDLYTKVMKAYYPLRYQETVERYAKAYDLDAALVYGVIRTESRFDPYAVSSAQAMGLMQLKEETAKDCARALKLQGFAADQLFDPEINIRLGCYYLNQLIEMYDGNTETAIAAYNGGPGNVDRWLKDQNESRKSGKLSRIPFPETARYVERVMHAYQTYQALYDEI